MRDDSVPRSQSPVNSQLFIFHLSTINIQLFIFYFLICDCPAIAINYQYSTINIQSSSSQPSSSFNSQALNHHHLLFFTYT
ncbi:MAG: hypothetical protein ACRC6M_08235 [Microcystaceae cyanobacterium]